MIYVGVATDMTNPSRSGKNNLRILEIQRSSAEIYCSFVEMYGSFAERWGSFADCRKFTLISKRQSPHFRDIRLCAAILRRCRALVLRYIRHSDGLQHAATQCTLKHAATHCNAVQRTMYMYPYWRPLVICVNLRSISNMCESEVH